MELLILILMMLRMDLKANEMREEGNRTQHINAGTIGIGDCHV